MKITIAKSAGFCFGVKRALDIALKTVSSKAEVYMLGDIVHNEDVVKKIKKAGIRKIKSLGKGKNKILLIRAHGASSYTIKRARKLGYQIIDATCPMVKEIHRIAAEEEREGYKIIIVGDKRHDEVLGIIGQLRGKAIVIDSSKDLALKAIKRIKKGAIVVQSTQNLQKVLVIVDRLKMFIKDLRFFNTICRPTRTKQADIKVMPQDNDVMIIIGSKTSANTRRLYEISKELNERSYWIQSKKDIKSSWFKQAEKVGVTAGASTPNSTTKEVVGYIRKINK